MSALDAPDSAQRTLRQRRLEHTYALMSELGLDVLVAASTDSIQHRGNVRYLTNYSTRYGASLAAVALGGEPVLVVPAGSFQLGWARTSAWVVDVRPVGDFAGATVDLVRQMSQEGAVVGLAGLENLPGAVGAQVVSALSTRRFEQISDAFRLMRATKSAEEQAMVRESARMADSVLRDVRLAAGAGIAEREFFARGAHRAALEGAEDCFLLASVGLDTVVMPMSTGRACEEHDILRF